MANEWTPATKAKVMRRPTPDHGPICPGSKALIDEASVNRTSTKSLTTCTQPDYFSPRDEICGANSSQPKDPHPSSSDTDETRSQPLKRATRTASRMPTMRRNTKSHHPISAQPSGSESFTPISSFIPTGVHGLAQPLGKYYPSNYENRPSRHAKVDAEPSPRPAPTTPAISEPRIPPYRQGQEPAPARSRSDLERRMQQYKREMVSQAATAAHALIKKGSNQSLGPAASPRKAARPSRIALPGNFKPEGLPDNFNLDGLLNVQLKPASPRLAPLGSPGPVTPMNLEDAHGDCYWSKGRGTPGSNASYQSRLRV